MAEPTQSRRSALRAIGLALAGAAGLWRFLTPRTAAHGRSGEPLVTVAESEVPSDGALVLPRLGVAVVSEGATLAALDLACTHLGCTVTATGSGFSCPCHGSRFTAAGEVTAGPAARRLRQLDITVENGLVTVSRDRSPGGPCACRSRGAQEA